ncbi:MAG: DUF4247 domain-containing protein [Clostridia bacterium]
MWQRLLPWIKTALIVSLATSVLAGCGGGQSVGSSYPLESITEKGNQTSRIYRAENKTVPEVAQELAAQNTPDEISKEDADHMFLIYSDQWYHLQKDAAKPSDTLIEVDSKQFVQQNYDFSFLQGYLLATVLDDLFDSHKKYAGKYRGYGKREQYKPIVVYHTPTSKEKKTYAPITKEGSGSIIRRSSSSDTISSKKDAGGSLFQKSDASSTSSSGKIIRNSSDSSYSGSYSKSKSNNSIFSRPKNNSPPRTKKGSGSLKRRR